MSTNWKHSERGQTLLMVTLTLLMMFGIIGLAVDVGWSYFVRKTAQAAADSAALAAVEAAMSSYSGGGSIDCTALTCGAPANCPASGNLTNGCKYAKKNGFDPAADSTVTVTLEADLGTNRQPPTAPGVTTTYWVTARVRQNIPQLFSAVMGHLTGVTGARATAAILESDTPGALILLNRQSDCLAMNGPNSAVCGVNLMANGSSNITAKAGILMSSTRNGNDLGIPKDGSQYAGELAGSANVTADFTGIRGTGTANANAPQWNAQWQNGLSDSNFFKDPMRTLNGQPPAPPATSQLKPVAGCAIAGGADAAHRVVLTPGKYYSTAGNGGCHDGDPIQITGYVEFSPGTSTYGNYTFFGGIKSTNSTNIVFDPGEYVFAGVKPGNNAAGTLFDITSGQVTLQDNTPLNNGNSVPNTDAGELFVFTRPDYPGLDTTGVPSTVTSGLDFGTSGFQAGNNNNVLINLHGVNEASSALPANIKNYFDPTGANKGQPVVLWQDQRNSVTQYYNGTTKNMACITGDSTTGCVNTLSHPDSPALFIQASPSIHLYGTVYQPRGSWTVLGGGGNYAGPLRIITGAIQFQGGADLNLLNLGAPLAVLNAALIE